MIDFIGELFLFGLLEMFAEIAVKLRSKKYVKKEA